MKRISIATALAISALFVTQTAIAVTIDDSSGNPNRFVGAVSPALPSPWFQQDVIGDVDKFAISAMDVEIIGGNLSVTVFSTYFDNIGELGTRLGDLFVSTNGWSPFGAAPYFDDDASNGETWEYALALDDHNGATTSGVATLYQVTSASDILLSTTEASGTIRLNQEALYNKTGNSVAVGTGTWAIINGGTALNFTIALSLLSGVTDTLGFHWATTCANDVIEGAAAIPEPGTLALLGCGLLGAAASRRRARRSA